MAKKSEKSDSSDSTEQQPKKRVEMPDPISEEAFEAQFEQPGSTEAEGAEQIKALMQAAQSGDLEGMAPSRELLDTARERLRESGAKEDAIRALTLKAEADRAEEAGHGPEPERVPFERLAEETGVSADSLMVTAKVDGEEIEVPLSEAVNGYQRQSDYTRSKQELAEHRQEAEQLRDAYAERLEMLAVTLGKNLTPQQQQAVAAEYQRVKQQAAAQEQATTAQVVEAEQDKLRESFGWEDESEWDEARGRLREYAHELGYSDEELSSVRDHRLLGVLERARRYEEVQRKGSEIQEQAKQQKSPTLQPGTRAGQRKPSNAQAARERLKRTGSKEDGVEAIVGLLSKSRGGS